MTEFDEATLRIMTSYCGGDPRIKREVTDEVFSEYGSETWTLTEFLKAIGDAVALIPETLRETARVELDGGYDESTALKIMYRRPETDEEVAERVAHALAYAKQKEASEKAEFERLKRKFA